MNSNRMLGLTTKSQAKSTEKLSSGYKINRAADDAAGLAISEKMRRQVRGLTQASLNAQDGISAVQTAEGALNEVQDMLQRMNELAVKAANGTMSESDRNAIQNEIDQLTTEIDRVATTTKFNETYLLKGAKGSVAGSLTYTKVSGSVSALSASVTIGGAAGKTISLDTQTGTANLAFGAAVKGATLASAKSATSSSKATTYALKVVNDKASKVAATNTKVTAKSITIGATTYMLIENTSAANASKEKLSASAVAKIINDEKIKSNTASPNSITTKAFTSMDALTSAIRRQYGEHLKSVTTYWNQDTGTLNLKFEAFADLNDSINFSLHVGADSSSDNKISVNISMMSARGLGVNGLNIGGDNDTKATKAIDIVADALQKVSDQRAALGAVQNRLEHTINNLDNVVENTQAAESAIRDTDMATQMVTYSNNQILAQAGQAMLAQSNQANQGVLSLLG